jgi:hypothetical protein
MRRYGAGLVMKVIVRALAGTALMLPGLIFSREPHRTSPLPSAGFFHRRACDRALLHFASTVIQGRGGVAGGSEKDAENSIVWLHSWVRVVLAGTSRVPRVGVPDPG